MKNNYLVIEHHSSVSLDDPSCWVVRSLLSELRGFYPHTLLIVNGTTGCGDKHFLLANQDWPLSGLWEATSHSETPRSD